MNNAILRIQVLDSAPEQDVFHQSAELFYVLEGSLEIRIGEQTSRLTEEDVFIVNVNKSYRAAASDNVLFVKITLPHQLISNAAQATHIQFWCDSSREENTQYQELRHTLKLLLDRYLAQRNPQKDFGYLALCYRLLDIVTTDFRSNIVEPVHMDKEERFRDRMDQINSYLHANYNQPLSSKELAEKLYLSQGYLSRFFRKNYGMSFAEYLTDIRLYHAVDDLLYTNMPITRIAFDNGFVNVTSFTKAFRKRYGATPSAIRKQRQEKELLAKSTDTDQAVEKRLDQLLRADDSLRDDPHSSNHVEQTCRGTAQTPLENIWCDTINVGPAAELLKSGVREHILLLTEMLHLQHVRFWNIFSKEMLIVPGEAGTYNFSKLDAVLDFLLENGLKPHMELGNKPRRLYRNAQNAILEEETVETFTETKEWEILFQSMMRHLRARYGSSQLNTWRLELWFDERAWGKSGANEDYFHRFNLIYNTAKSHAPAIEVGGCGLRIGFSDEGDVTLEFLRQWNRQPVRPDFLSMLYYPYDRGEVNQDSYSRRSTDQDGILHKVNAARRLMKEAGMDQAKLYVTEWNLTISDRNYINDTCYKAAYLVKNGLDLCGKADLVCYFFASDLVSEYLDSRGPLHGGSGLISKDGIMKPAAFAYLFLSWLYGNRIASGKNFIVTTDGQGSYGILCHNVKTPNSRYYLTRENEVRKEQIQKYFDDLGDLELSLSLADVENGSYQIKSYQVGDKTGNLLYFWRELGFEPELSRHDVRYLRHICEPKLTIHTGEAQSHSLPVKVCLKANEIRFLRIRKTG